MSSQPNGLIRLGSAGREALDPRLYVEVLTGLWNLLYRSYIPQNYTLTIENIPYDDIIRKDSIGQ